MSKRWIIILLLISITFNLAVLGSFVYIRFFVLRDGCPPPPPYMEPHAGGRGLPDEILWQRLPMDGSIMELRREFGKSKIALMQELAKDPLDEQQISRILEESLKKHSDLELKLGQRLIELRKTMNAEEASEFFGKRIEKMQSRRDGRMHENLNHTPRRRMK